MNMISMFQPTVTRSPVSPGVVHSAERPVSASTQPFHVSLKKSRPKTVRPASTASQLRVLRAL